MVSFGLVGTANSTDEEVESNTPWMAVSEGNLELLKSSLQRLNLSVNAADENGYTILHAAASFNQMDIMKYLLEQGVNVHAVDNDGDSALHYAGNTASARFLVETAQSNPVQVNREGKTPLQTKQEELDEMMQDEDIDDDDDDVEALREIVQYLSTLR